MSGDLGFTTTIDRLNAVGAAAGLMPQTDDVLELFKFVHELKRVGTSPPHPLTNSLLRIPCIPIDGFDVLGPAQPAAPKAKEADEKGQKEELAMDVEDPKAVVAPAPQGLQVDEDVMIDDVDIDDDEAMQDWDLQKW
jgi:hypothetical protein